MALTDCQLLCIAVNNVLYGGFPTTIAYIGTELAFFTLCSFVLSVPWRGENRVVDRTTTRNHIEKGEFFFSSGVITTTVAGSFSCKKYSGSSIFFLICAIVYHK